MWQTQYFFLTRAERSIFFSLFLGGSTCLIVIGQAVLFGPKKSRATLYQGSSAEYETPVAFRPCLATGLAFSCAGLRNIFARLYS